jgi:hypothetical protein
MDIVYIKYDILVAEDIHIAIFCFCTSFNDAVSDSDYIVSNDSMMLEEMLKDEVMD